MFSEFAKAFLLIFVAEMGDKTQILALAFATKYNAFKVLFGVFIGVLFNHLIAVIAGIWLSHMLPLDYVKIAAAFAFILFGLWTLKKDDDEDEKKSNYNIGPVLTVAMAFFIGELGDKTQLTAFTLSTTASFPIFILAGTVAGMLIISGMGIIVGNKLGQKMPEKLIKFISAIVFIFFGIISLFNTLPDRYINSVNITLFSAIIFIIIILITKSNRSSKKRKRRKVRGY